MKMKSFSWNVTPKMTDCWQTVNVASCTLPKNQILAHFSATAKKLMSVHVSPNQIKS